MSLNNEGMLMEVQEEIEVEVNEEEEDQQEFNPDNIKAKVDNIILLTKQIEKSLEDIKKECIPTILGEISTVLSYNNILQTLDIENETKVNCRDKLLGCMSEVLSKLLASNKINDEYTYIRVRDIIQKIVQLISSNLKTDNPLVRKCLLSLFNPENAFYLTEFDHPNRCLFQELVFDIQERKQWFEALKIGDLVDAVKIEESYKKFCWSHAKVADKTEIRVKLTFLSDSNKYDRWIERNSYELREYKSRCNDFEWRQELKPDMIVDVCDTACVWYQSTILDSRNVIIEGNQETIKELFIGYRVYCPEGEYQDSQGHYKGWTSKYDEWLSAHSPRIQMAKKMSKKLFKQASQNNSEKIIDDSNDIIFEYEYFFNKKIYAIHRVQNILKFVNSSYIQFINDFGEGFIHILNLINSSNSILLGEKDTYSCSTSCEQLTEPISFEVLCDFIKVIYHVSPFLFKSFCADYIPKLIESVKINIFKSSDSNIKSYKREQINDMINNLGVILMRYYSIGQKIEIIEEIEFQIAKVCFESTSVRQKTIGLQLITQIVQKYSKTSKKSYQLNELKCEIERNKYIQQLFSEDIHIQLLEKCTEFFIFLIEQSLFNASDMRNLWKVIQRSHDDTKICYYNLLKQVSKYLKVSHIKVLMEEINLREENKYKQCEIDILFEICFEVQQFQAERTVLQCDIFNIIWNYINEFEDELMDTSEFISCFINQNKKEIEKMRMQQTVDKFCKLIREKKKEFQILLLREQLIKNIKHGKNTYFSLEILQSVMNQFNQSIETQRKHLDNMKKECSSIINPIENSHIEEYQLSQGDNQSLQAETQNIEDQRDENVMTNSSIVNQNSNESNLINITDLYAELQNDLINDNNNISQRLPHLMLPNAQFHLDTQSYQLPLSPSLCPSNQNGNQFGEGSTNYSYQREKEIQLAKIQLKKNQIERKQKCEELCQLILQSLKHFKRKYKAETLQSSPQMTKSYISQIEQHINFLSFMNDACQVSIINYELISELLTELIEKQVVNAESEFFYRWLKRSNKRGKVIIHYVKKFFLQKVINDDHFLSTLSLEGLDCFKYLFVQINIENNNIVTIDDHHSFENIAEFGQKDQSSSDNKVSHEANLVNGNYRADFLYLLNKHPSLLEGISFLWKITFLSLNEEVSNQGSIFLVNLYLKTTENLEDKVVEIRNSFLQNCLNNIKENKDIVRTLKLLHTFLDYSELVNIIIVKRGIGNLIAHSAESIQEKNTLIVKNQISQTANVMKIQNQFQLPCLYSKTLYQLRIQLSEIFKIGVDEILLSVPGKNDSYGQLIVLKDHMNGYTLQALDFTTNQTIIVQKQQKIWNSSVKLIKDDDQLTNKALEIIQEWFKAYSENGKMSMQNCAHFIESCTKDACKIEDYRVIDVFKNWDSNSDGYLSEQDFLEFYRKGSKEKKETVMRNIQAHYYSEDLNRIYAIKVDLNQQEVKELPRYLLSQNEAFQKEIFKAYECKNMEWSEQVLLSQYIEKLFNRLPTCTYIKTILDDSHKIENFFLQSSKYEFLYLLECIEHKFFQQQCQQKEDEGQGQENKPIDLQNIINKLKTSQVIENSQEKLEQSNAPSSIENQPSINGEIQNNQPLNQMSNENKIINVGLQNLISTNDRGVNSMCEENDWIQNFFSVGLFEKLLDKFNTLMKECTLKYENENSQMIIESNEQDKKEQQQITLNESLNNQSNSLEFIETKLFQKFIKIFIKFISACLVEKYPYIFYLTQYMGTLYISIEEIEEDLNKRINSIIIPQNSIDDNNNNNNNNNSNHQNNINNTNNNNNNTNNNNTNNLNESENNQNQQNFIGPILPKEQQIFSVYNCRIQQPKIDTFQLKMIEYIHTNSSVQSYLMNLQIQNMPSIIVNTLLQTLRSTTKWSTPFRTLITDSLNTLLLLLYKNAEHFTAEFKSDPNTFLLFKEGLFYKQNRIIRQIFSFFLFLLVKQLKDKSWVIQQLIELIPNSNGQEDQAETCSQFFSLLCLIFKKYQEDVSSNGFNFDGAFQQVFETLKKICSKESVLNSQKDNLLNGYLQLTMTMLTNQNSISAKSEEDYVQYLLFNCLFHQSLTINHNNNNNTTQMQIETNQEIQQHNHTNTFNHCQVNRRQQPIDSLNQIKCFHFDSRQLCYKQILEICKQHPEYLPNTVLSNMSSVIQSINRSSKQSYNPESNIKSPQGYVGIKNLGTICYMNSMIQQLFQCQPFIYSLLAAVDHKEQILTANSQGREFDDNILHQIQRMITYLLFSIKRDYNPEGFCFSLKGYDGMRTNLHLQQDTQEFLNLFVERIHTALDNTPFRQVFDTLYGVTTITERTCMKCNKKTQTVQPFYMIPIKINMQRTLMESLDKTFRSESIQDYKCDDCKQTSEANSQEYIKNLPNTLILNLFRISHNIETGLNQKDNNKITFEQNLNMHPFMYHPQNKMEIEDPNLEDYQYTLKGVVIHNGTADYGHYYSVIKTAEDKWLEFNDSNVCEYNPKDLASDCFGQDFEDIKIPKVFYESQKSAYLLIYEKTKKNELEFIIKTEAEKDEVITKLGIKNPTMMSFWKLNDQQSEEEKQSQYQKGSEYLLKADYNDVNLFIVPEYQEQVAEDNFQFICEKLILNNSLLSFIQDTILTVPMPDFYMEELKAKPFKPYLPIELLKECQNKDELLEVMRNYKNKYSYDSILELIAYVFFNFITVIQDSSIIDSWFDLFYRFSTICAETSYKIFNHYVLNRMELFWQDTLLSTNLKVRKNSKQIILHFLNIIIKHYQIDLMKPNDNQQQEQNSNTPQGNVIQFLNNLLSGLYTQVTNNMYKCEQYFEVTFYFLIHLLIITILSLTSQFLRDFADSGFSQALFLISNNVIDKLLDFYLAEESPINGKYLTAKKSLIGSGNQSQPQFNPLLATVYTLLCKQNLIKLKHSEDFQMMIMNSKLYLRAFRMKNDVNIVGKIISHMSYKNYEYSYFIGKFILSGISEKYRSDDIQYYFELMSHFTTIYDEVQNYRFEWIFGIPQLKKDFYYEDYSMQLFLDDANIEYISTLCMDENNDQIKGLLSKVQECNMGYADSRENSIVYKILYLMDVNDNIFKYFLTIPPPNYLQAYYIDFVALYLQKNTENKTSDAYSIAQFAQIEETYKSLQQKIRIQEEQFKLISQELFSLNKTGQDQNNIVLNESEERQRLFDTYIYGQEIQQNRINPILNIQNYANLQCYTIEYEVYFCQNKISLYGKSLVFPPETISFNTRVDPNKINLYSNAFLLFNKQIKEEQVQLNLNKVTKAIEQTNQISVEEEAQQNQPSSKNLRFSSVSSLKSNEATKGETNQGNINEQMVAEVQVESPINQNDSNTEFPSAENLKTPSLPDTEIVLSSENIEMNKETTESRIHNDIQKLIEDDNRVCKQKKEEESVQLNIPHLKRDSCIREIIIENTHPTHTYKLTLRIQIVNQFSSFISLSNFKYPNMIERIIPPNSKCTILTLSKSIPLHSWSQYDLKFDVHLLTDTAKQQQQQPSTTTISTDKFNQDSNFLSNVALSALTKIKKPLPLSLPNSNDLDKQENSLVHETESNNIIICKHCTLRNSSNTFYCEVCNNPLFESNQPSSPHFA